MWSGEPLKRQQTVLSHTLASLISTSTMALFGAQPRVNHQFLPRYVSLPVRLIGKIKVSRIYFHHILNLGIVPLSLLTIEWSRSRPRMGRRSLSSCQRYADLSLVSILCHHYHHRSSTSIISVCTLKSLGLCKATFPFSWKDSWTWAVMSVSARSSVVTSNRPFCVYRLEAAQSDGRDMARYPVC